MKSKTEESTLPPYKDVNDFKGDEHEGDVSGTKKESNLKEAKDQTGGGTSVSGEINQNVSEDNTTSPAEDFNLDQFLDEHYKIEGGHYKTKSFGTIKGTERIDYQVDLRPDTKEIGKEIRDVLKKGIPYENEKTEAIMTIAKDTLTDLPKANKHIHIDSVNWVSYEGDFEIMLIQDFNKSTICSQ